MRSIRHVIVLPIEVVTELSITASGTDLLVETVSLLVA